MSSSCLLVVLLASIHGLPVDVIPGSEPTRAGSIPLGNVFYSPQTRRVEVDGVFNLNRGFVEYLACAPGVKPHETLVSLDCDPADLQGALLLLGLKNSRRPESEYDLGPLTGGDRVIISLRFQVQDGEGRHRIRTIRVENCLINAPMERTMARCGFSFTGSGFQWLDPPPRAPEGAVAEEHFMARVTGEMVALSHRPWAILDNPLALPYPDGDYFAYSDVLPLHRRDDPPEVTMLLRRAVAGDVDPQAIRMELPPRPLDRETEPALDEIEPPLDEGEGGR
ncbi:MAG: YdjY domain-containing protein [Planctomycetota bacterium]|nr:YdjY domain-containing protein [Planctomycetota bacterium]